MNLFVELSLIIVMVTVVSGVMKLLKQPIIIGYILTGLLLGPQFLNLFSHHETLNIFSEMGIAILLFIVGLHLDPRELAEFGKSAFMIGFFQVMLTGFLTYLLAVLLGFSSTTSVYLAIAFSFSSTIVVLKMLSDKKDLEKLYGRLDIGILLFQDIVAALALIFVSTFSNGHTELISFVVLFAKGFALTLFVVLISMHGLPRLSTFFARSQEYLFLFSLAWGFGLASLFSYIGFSLEIGALVAGVALSVSPYSAEISAKLKSLRDFFVVMFFILLGARVSFDSLGNLIVPIVVFTLFILLIKPLIVMSLMGLFRYSKKTGFFGGLSLAQISEFSMILLLVGFKVGHIDESTISMVTMLGIISIGISTYFMTHLEKIYPKVAHRLSVFERKRIVKEKSIVGDYSVILFGCNRGGYDVIKTFHAFGPKFLAVDFDPDIIDELDAKGINCKYGDAEDSEFLDSINVGSADIVISTIPDFQTNLFLLEKVRSENANSIVMVISYSILEALRLYKEGASYVSLPHFIGGAFGAELAKRASIDPGSITDTRNHHIAYLEERHLLGHAHPRWGHNG